MWKDYLVQMRIKYDKIIEKLIQLPSNHKNIMNECEILKLNETVTLIEKHKITNPFNFMELINLQ